MSTSTESAPNKASLSGALNPEEARELMGQGDEENKTQTKQNENDIPANGDVIYVCGDSHCLSSAWQRIKLQVCKRDEQNDILSAVM